MAKEIGILETLALIKAGYSKKEIKAMADASEEAPEASPKASEEPEVQKEVVEETSAPEPEPDYKKLFEDMQKTNEDLQKKLAAAQALNTNTDISINAAPKKDVQSVVNDIFRNVLN